MNQRLGPALVLILAVSTPAAAVVVDPANRAFLEQANGSPHFTCGPGDPEGFLYLGTRNADGTRSGGGQEAMIQRLADKGGRTLYVQTIRNFGGDGTASESPFNASSDPASGLDPEMMAQWETWFDQMEAAGIVLYLFLYDDSCCPTGFNCGTAKSDSVNDLERTYLEALVNRFEHHANLVWVYAEEYSEKWSAGHVANAAAIIRGADDHDRPIGNHQLTKLTFDHAEDPNLDVFMMQCREAAADGGGDCDGSTTPTQLNRAMNEAWTSASGRYVVNMSEIAFGGTGYGDRSRQLMWATAMGGAYFMANGWKLTGPTDPPDSNLNECRWLQGFFEARTLQKMAPSNLRAAGSGDYALVDDAAKAYIVYTDSYSTSLGLTQLVAGTYRLDWLDTKTGRAFTENRTVSTAGMASWPLPSTLAGATEVALSVKLTAGDTTGPGTPGGLRRDDTRP